MSFRISDFERKKIQFTVPHFLHSFQQSFHRLQHPKKLYLLASYKENFFTVNFFKTKFESRFSSGVALVQLLGDLQDYKRY